MSITEAYGLDTFGSRGCDEADAQYVSPQSNRVHPHNAEAALRNLNLSEEQIRDALVRMKTEAWLGPMAVGEAGASA